MNAPLELVRPALVLVDLQNDNVHPDGAFASSGAPAHAASQGLVEHVRALLDWARDHDVPVIHNHIVAFPGRDFGGRNAPIGPDSLRLGSWGGLEPVEGEPVLLRNRMSLQRLRPGRVAAQPRRGERRGGRRVDEHGG